MCVAKYENYGHLELLVHDELAPYRIQCSSREWFNVPVEHIHAVIKTIVGVCDPGCDMRSNVWENNRPDKQMS